jgi:gluconate 2-dehydrogenase gamma chain
MNRRNAIKLAALGVAASRHAGAQHQMHALAAQPAQYKLQFFTAAENELLGTIAGMIIPADDHSGGARAANVSLYIDLIAANSGIEAQNRWRGGLRAATASGFASMAEAERGRLLDRWATQDDDAGRFFKDVRQATVFAYYSSRIGLIDELGYQGNQAMGKFPGCVTG